MIELQRFRLAADSDPGEFMAIDRRVQTEIAYHQVGLLRRTTARSLDGGWIVIETWRSEVDADAAASCRAGDPLTAQFLSYIDATTLLTERFSTLD